MYVKNFEGLHFNAGGILKEKKKIKTYAAVY